jgi:hypothetical protein
MEIDVQVKEGRIIVKPVGRVDSTVAEEFQQRLFGTIDAHPDEFYVVPGRRRLRGTAGIVARLARCASPYYAGARRRERAARCPEHGRNDGRADDQGTLR